MKRKKLFEEVLGFHWHFQIGGTEEEAIRWFCRIYNLPLPEPETHEGNVGSCTYSNRVRYAALIWLNKDCRSSTLSHEIAHAVVRVCSVLDLDPRQADEFQASYTGYLTKHLTKLFYQKKKAKP